MVGLTIWLNTCVWYERSIDASIYGDRQIPAFLSETFSSLFKHSSVLRATHFKWKILFAGNKETRICERSKFRLIVTLFTFLLIGILGGDVSAQRTTCSGLECAPSSSRRLLPTLLLLLPLLLLPLAVWRLVNDAWWTDADDVWVSCTGYFTETRQHRQRNPLYTRRTDVTVVRGNMAISMLCGNTAYRVKLSEWRFVALFE